jgi:PAS domain S-box-containing protein
MWMKLSHWRYLAGVGVLAAAYFASARLGLSLATVGNNVTLIWPPTGVALAALLLFGYRYWPGVMVGAFVSNLSTGAPLGFVGAVAVGNTLEALAGASILRRAGFRSTLERIRDVLSLVLLAAALSTMIAATVGTTAMCWMGLIPCSGFLATWWVWWLGNAMGALVFAPVLLVWRASPQLNWQRRRVLEAGVLAVILVILSAFAFGQISSPTVVLYPAAYLLILMIVWAALRFGQREVTAASLFVTIIAIWGLSSGVGLFIGKSPAESVWLLSAYVTLLSLLGLLLSAATNEHRQAERAQRQLIERLKEERPPVLEADVPRGVSREQMPTVNISASLLIVTLVAIVVITVFQVMKSAFAPDLSLWQSHLYTIAFTAAVMPLAAYFVLRRQRAFYRQIVEEVSERKRIEEIQHRLAERTGQLEQTTEQLRAEIADRKRIEEDLQRERDFASQVMNALGQGVTVTGPGGRFEYVNPAYAQMLGYQPEEIIGRTPKDFTLADDYGLLDQAHAERKAGKMTTYVTRIHHRDGRLVHALIVSAPRWQDGKVVGAVAVATDLTEIKKAEETLRESEATNRALLNAIPDLMFRFGRDGTFLGYNAPSDKLLFVPPEQFLGRKVSEVLPPALAQQTTQAIAQTLATGETQTFEYELPLDGKRRHWEARMAVSGADEVLTVMREITERKHAEAERERLLAAEREQRLLAETLGEVTLALTSLTSRNAVLDEILRQTQRLTPFTAANIALVEGEALRISRWQGYEAMGNENFIAGLVQPLADFPLEDAVLRSRLPLVIPDTQNEPRWIRLQETAWIRSTLRIPICLYDQVLGLLRLDSDRPGNFSDHDVQSLQPLANAAAIALDNARLFEATKTSEAKYQALSEELEQRVIQRTAQLEAANRELEAFSYSVSHDLRAPLRGLDGFSRALLEDYGDKLDDQGKLYLQRILTGAQRMSKLIDDMLTLSRVMRREMKVEPVDLSAMARAVASELQRSDPGRRVQFVLAEEVTARGDAGLLRVVIENLFYNAWKFTARHEEARIEFGTMPLPDEGQAYFVRDDGAGFDMAYADKLFGAFQRLHSPAEFEGAGIGLATIQRIVHRHGGRVWAEGAVGKGATFYFTL